MFRNVAAFLVLASCVAFVRGATRHTGIEYHGYVSNLQPTTGATELATELIVGGSKAPSGLRKKMALVVVETKNGELFSCTGSVIAKKFILCAAHCFITGPGKKNKVDAKSSYVLVGEKRTDLQYFSSPANKYFMKQVFIYKKYKDNGFFRYDVALVELKEKISNSLYSPMMLGGAPSSGPEKVIVAGYGAKGSFKPSGRKLLQAKVLYQDWDVCNAEQGFPVSNAEAEEVCSTSKGFPNKGKTGICFGDSGGPIVIKQGGSYVQYGVASYFYGDKCESRGTVFVHQRVSFFLKKINSKVQKGKNNGWKKLK